MNMWIITAIVIGVLIIGAFAISGYVTAQQQAKTSETGCGSCNGKCTASNNCGQATCSAATTGTCNCGK